MTLKKILTRIKNQLGHNIVQLFFSQLQIQGYVSIHRDTARDSESNLKRFKILRINADLLASDLMLTKLHVVINLPLVLQTP